MGNFRWPSEKETSRFAAVKPQLGRNAMAGCEIQESRFTADFAAFLNTIRFSDLFLCN